MHRIERPGRPWFGKQRGLTLVGLIFLLAILSCVALLGLKVVPAYAEYRAVLNAVRSAKASATTVREAQRLRKENTAGRASEPGIRLHRHHGRERRGGDGQAGRIRRTDRHESSVIANPLRLYVPGCWPVAASLDAS
jgi:Tfp pilus assembly major pilin PilA